MSEFLKGLENMLLDKCMRENISNLALETKGSFEAFMLVMINNEGDAEVFWGGMDNPEAVSILEIIKEKLQEDETKEKTDEI